MQIVFSFPIQNGQLLNTSRCEVTGSSPNQTPEQKTDCACSLYWLLLVTTGAASTSVAWTGTFNFCLSCPNLLILKPLLCTSLAEWIWPAQQKAKNKRPKDCGGFIIL